jgi:SAM-dependent methyltransferase
LATFQTRTTDAAFAKYAEAGAYHWREIGGHWIWHNAFTAERYRRVLGALDGRRIHRVLDVGCGDGALIGMGQRRWPGAEWHGCEPNELGRRLAGAMLARHGVTATLHAELAALPDAFFDAVTCTEVIEHVHDPAGLLRHVGRVLAPGGAAVLTTPVRLTEIPEDPNHVREWFPTEFRALCDSSGLAVVTHDLVMPMAGVEAYFWRPRIFLRVPVFRVLCNVLSIYCGVNPSALLAMRPRLPMLQMVVLVRS